MEELFATKQRVVHILEEIVDKEYITPAEMQDMIEENWELTEEYEKQIAELIQGNINKLKKSSKAVVLLYKGKAKNFL